MLKDEYIQQKEFKTSSLMPDPMCCQQKTDETHAGSAKVPRSGSYQSTADRVAEYLLASGQNRGRNQQRGRATVEKLEGHIVNADMAELEEELCRASDRLQNVCHVHEVE